jgi:hypothetical protein
MREKAKRKKKVKTFRGKKKKKESKLAEGGDETHCRLARARWTCGWVAGEERSDPWAPPAAGPDAMACC